MNALPSAILRGFIAKKRAELDMNKSQLAKKSGVNRTTISMMENNQSGLTFDNAVKVLKGLGSSLGEFETYLKAHENKNL